MRSTTEVFPTIEMVSERALELGMSYGTYSSSSAYMADIESGYFGTTYTKTGRRKRQEVKEDIKALMIKAQTKPVAIFCISEDSAKAFREYLRKEVSRGFPKLLNNYTTTGSNVYINGHEVITVCTVPEWNENQKKRLNLFTGYAYSFDIPADGLIGIENLAYSPEKYI